MAGAHGWQVWVSWNPRDGPWKRIILQEPLHLGFPALTTSLPNPLPPADLDAVLARTEGLWKDLQGGRIFLTGGSGFFGAWLVETFAWAQTRLNFRGSLWLLCRDPEGWAARFPHVEAHPAIRVHRGDLGGFSGPGGAFHGLIHAAVEAGPPLAQFRNAVEGAGRVLDFARASGALRLLLTSSGAVYGPHPRTTRPIPEDRPSAPATEEPDTAYGQAKRASEFLFSAYSSETGAQAVLARGFAFVGPHLKLDANFAIGNFIRDAMAGRDIQVQGDGTPLRSYLYAGDLATWLWTLYFKGPSRRPVNVGSDRAVAIADLASTVATTLAPGCAVAVAGTPQGGLAPLCYVPDITRAREELGLEPWTSLEEAIRRTAAWHRSRP